MKYWLVISEIPEPFQIRCFPFSFNIVRFDQKKYQLEKKPKQIYAKVLGVDDVDSSKTVSNAGVHVFDVELLDAEVGSKPKQLVEQWSQLEAFSTDLFELKNSVKCLSVGWLPWRMSKLLHRLSNLKCTLGEVRGMVRYLGAGEPWLRERILSVNDLIDDVERECDRQQGKIGSRTITLDFLYVVLGLALGLLISSSP